LEGVNTRWVVQLEKQDIYY